ncbi:MAG: type III-A CRISPR-associated protein Csm2, partial [Candidatus Omnitrophica bacterium]|nr:type III-A CRISPR-associated protein Csm2 [Candidatus Omnitrophota bacterium]
MNNLSYKGNNNKEQEKFNGKFEPKWITDGLTNEAIEFAEEFAEFLVSPTKKDDKLSTSQIRNVFGEIKNIQMRLSEKTFKDEQSNFFLLKAKLAYAAGRNNKPVLDEFRKIFDLAHKEVQDKKTF